VNTHKERVHSRPFVDGWDTSGLIHSEFGDPLPPHGCFEKPENIHRSLLSIVSMPLSTSISRRFQHTLEDSFPTASSSSLARFPTRSREIGPLETFKLQVV
jgi:hypothetical protein